MQDIHVIGGGRIFGGGDGGNGGGAVIDRRLRPHSHLHNLQALKCPRCDSLNTKFCYYNNYNLSQPRHFCKSCRRYWTKGGVLRNVPVGGGCRKAKRSSKPKPAPETAVVASSKERNKSNSHSSSESSSLTATNFAVAGTEVVSALASSGSGTNTVTVPDSKLFISQSGNSNFESGMIEQHEVDCGIFSDIGSFSSLILSRNDQMMFGLNNSEFRVNQQGVKMQGNVSGGSMDESAQLELSDFQNKPGNVAGFESLNWQGDGDDGLFDLSNNVDQGYWNQPQWTDQYQANFYLP